MIRLATIKDAEALRDLGISSFVAAFGHLYSPSDLQLYLAENYALQSWKCQIGASDRPIWLADAPDGHLAGYAQASPCELPVDPVPDGALQLQRLYVRPGALSSGIGGALMSRVLEWVEAAGRPPLFLGVWSGNKGAQRFYARYGFYKVGEYDFPVGEQVDLEYILRRD
ncbi:GNAT family N-acetyltransferase [Hyphomonas chukchiensis]|uniref:GNAT family N-acetyltransferase n=1 Tax=Hyphomonas chukchiensis TaxID=1280947 RepID=UPI0030F7D9A0